MIVHLNGCLIPAKDAAISPFDRGFLFGDGIYEGLRAAKVGRQRRVIGMNRHQRRMSRGLREAGIGFDPATLASATDALLDANGLADAFVYWQVTRGTPDLESGPVRSRIPPAGMQPTIFGYCTELPAFESLDAPATKRAATHLDARWELGHIKSVSLLANIMAALDVARLGADEAILIRGEAETALVTEGTYTNVLIATERREAGRLPPPFDRFDVTTPSLASAPLLAGVTREIVLDLERNIREHAVESRDLLGASEVILLGTTTMITSVTHLDGRTVGQGRPGPVARHLFDTLMNAIRSGRDDDSAQRTTREHVGPETVGAL